MLAMRESSMLPTSAALMPTTPPILPSAREILGEDPEPVPSWLRAYRTGVDQLPAALAAFLSSRIAFYPGSGIVDGELFETFTAAHAVHCVLHADLLHGSALVADVLSRRFRPYIHVAGYRVIDLQQLDASTTRTLLALSDEHPWGQDPALQGACWAVLEREPEYTDDHGPARLAFLHVQCEAVWLYWNLWARSRERAPYGILIQDHGYGGNWTKFGPGGALHDLAWEGCVWPKWILAADGSAWPGYRPVSSPTTAREFPLPPELQMGDLGFKPSRTLYLDDRHSTFPEAIRAEPSPSDEPLDFGTPMTKRNITDQRQLYFAYGSNMDAGQFKQRCPHSELLGRAVLHDYRWIITDRGVASVSPHPGARVYGVLARLTQDDEDALNDFEGVQKNVYRREFLAVESADGETVTALVYIANDMGEGSPRPGYLERVLSGARHHNLPSAAIAEIESWKDVVADPSLAIIYVFVYGTLKRGHGNHSCIAEGIFVGEATTVEFYALHVDGLPMVDRNNPVSPVHGEVYKVSTDTLMELDRLEGHPYHYRRAMVSVALVGGETLRVWLYFHTEPSGPILESGRYDGDPSRPRPM